MRTQSLRLQFLAALAASGALVSVTVAACGGAVQDDGKKSAGTTSGGTSSGGTSSGASGNTNPPTTSSPPTKPPPPPTECDRGTSEQACYTRAQLEAQLRNPPFGGDVDDAGTDADVSVHFDPNGCLPSSMVQDSCCNAAVSGPIFTGSTCCYVHCTGGCCGRPFIVAGRERVADVRDRADWLIDAAPKRTEASDARAIDPMLRQRLATAWQNDAVMEHASIAAFARFTLELLAHGAPAELLLAAQDATRDEVEHARACFSIASRYAGRALGPGKLDVSGAEPASNLVDVVRAAILEGCVGETLSALLAEARLARAEDGDVRAALRRIANEEARHAELAWRFVGWAIATGGDGAADRVALRAAVASAFAEALATVPRAFDVSLRGIASAELRAHGLLDEETAREVAARALADVIAPCAEALAAGGERELAA